MWWHICYRIISNIFIIHRSLFSWIYHRMKSKLLTRNDKRFSFNGFFTYYHFDQSIFLSVYIICEWISSVFFSSNLRPMQCFSCPFSSGHHVSLLFTLISSYNTICELCRALLSNRGRNRIVYVILTIYSSNWSYLYYFYSRFDVNSAKSFNYTDILPHSPLVMNHQ